MKFLKNVIAKMFPVALLLILTIVIAPALVPSIPAKIPPTVPAPVEPAFGKGQTTVIVGVYGSPAVLRGLRDFSTGFVLHATVLTVLYPTGTRMDSGGVNLRHVCHRCY